MKKDDFAVFLEQLHSSWLAGLDPAMPVSRAKEARNFPPGAGVDLTLFIESRVTVGDVRAWMIQAGAMIPGAPKPSEPRKPAGTSHGAKTKDAFIVMRLDGRPFMPGLFGLYKDALDASAIADMPTKIDRYSIPLTTAGEYCEKCVELVVKASLSRAETASYHED